MKILESTADGAWDVLEVHREKTSDLSELTVASVVCRLDGSVMTFSKYDNEKVWIADSLFARNGCPIFVNPVGGRFVRNRLLKAEHPLTSLLDKLAPSAEFVKY